MMKNTCNRPNKTTGGHNNGQMDQRIKETHDTTWERFASIGGISSIVLPLLNEFEGVGEEVMMGLGGAGMASVFAVLVKIGRVTTVVQELTEEQDQAHQEMNKAERKQIKRERKRKKRSDYCHDPIGWCDSEFEGEDGR